MWAKDISNLFFFVFIYLFRFVAANYMPLGSIQIGLGACEPLLRHRWALLVLLDAAGRFNTRVMELVHLNALLSFPMCDGICLSL